MTRFNGGSPKKGDNIVGLCKCGCGQEVKKDYAVGHWIRVHRKDFSRSRNKTDKNIDAEEPRYCECGCGELIPYKASHRWTKTRFIKNHQNYSKELNESRRIKNTGRKKSEEEKEKLSRALKGHPNHFFKHTEEAKEKIRNSHLGMKHTEETKKKLSKMRKGKNLAENNPNWKGGNGLSERNKIMLSEEYSNWRKTIYKRDNYTCQKCGEVDRGLRAHHIFSFGHYINLRFLVENGITFCKDCHREFHSTYGNRMNNITHLMKFLGKFPA